MILDVDVLGSCVMFWIVCKCDGTLAVGIDGVLIADVVADFFKKTVDLD